MTEREHEESTTQAEDRRQLEGAPEASQLEVTLPRHDDDLIEEGAPEAVEAELAPPSREELEAADRRVRRARRKRLLLWSTPVALILALIAGKLLSMIFIANQAVSQYEARSFEESLNTSELLTYGNVVEPWKAHYDVGTNYLQLGVLPEARMELEQALQLAAPSEACPIRANLAITIERLGDLAATNGDEAAAQGYYEEAKRVLQERDPSCQQSSSEPSSQETQQRLDEKTNTSSSPDPNSSASPTPSPGATSPAGETPTPSPSSGGTPQTPGSSGEPQSPEEQLDEQLGENQQQRQEQLDEENNGGSGGVDKPW